MGNPRRMPSMNGYGLEIVGYIGKTQAQTETETV
jgi:3,4-dihydroxy 2-butanone 4-phosphate synthase/GTP cyclohydrolase II